MGTLQTIKTAIVTRVKAMTLRDPIRAWLTDGLLDAAAKHVADPYREAPYIHTAVGTLASLVAGVPLQVFDRSDTLIEDDADESLRVLRRPNAIDDHRAFIERTVILKHRDGQVFWVLSERFERPLERAVYVVPAAQMRPLKIDGLFAGWIRTQGGRREEIEPERVARMFFVDPDDELSGLSPVRAAQLSIDAHVHAARYNVNVFYNGAEPGSIYVADKSITPEQREQLEKRIEDRHRGVDNVGRPMILGGGLKPDRPPSHNDLQYIDGQRLTARQQIAPLRVQPIYAGLYEDANYNTANVQERLQWDLAVLPELKHLIEIWNLFVQRGVDDTKYVMPDLDAVPVLQERELERTTKVLAMQAHGIPLNVLIDTYGLALPHQPWGDEPLVSAGQVPISLVFEEARAAAQSEQEPEGESEQEQTEGTEDPPRSPLPPVESALERVREVIEADSEKDKKRRVHAAWMASFAGLRRTTRRRLRAFMLRQRDETIRRLNRAGLPARALSTQHSGLRTEERQEAIGNRQKQGVEEWIGRILFDLDAENRKLTALAKFQVREGIEHGGAQAGAEGQAPAEWEFNVDSPAVKRRLSQQVIKVRKVNVTTHKLIRRALTDGLDANETVNEIAERVGQAMGRRANVQSWRIANTEMAEAVNAGRHEGFKQANVKHRAWLTSGRGVEPGGPVRKSHWNAERATAESPIKTSQQFALYDPDTGQVSWCDHPGQGTLPPGERINCSCTAIARATAAGKSVTLDDYLARGFVLYREKAVAKLRLVTAA